MAMRTATPWWLAWTNLAMLLILFVSQRLLDPWDTLQTVTTAVAVGAIVVTVAIRVFATLRSGDSRRRVERTQLLASIGTLLAVVCYALTTTWGIDLIGGADWSPTGKTRWIAALRVLCAIYAAASILPMIMIEATLGLPRRERFDFAAAGNDDAVEYRRVRELGLSGLTVALAAGLLMVTCNVARNRNMREDVSYFKTSAPGDSTKAILGSTTEPIKVLLFFPEINEVKEEARAYFDELARSTGRLEIVEYTVNRAAKMVSDHKVTKDGTVVLVRGEGEDAKSEKIELDTDIEKARRPVKTAATTRPTLRNLDAAVNAALMKLVRDKRRAYLTVGHGELNDPDSLDSTMRDKLPDARATVIKAILQAQNYEVKNLGLIDGLGSKIPDDATMVLALGPRTPFQDEELDTLDQYLARGGNLLIALDPKSDAVLGQLEGRLGVHFDRKPILDDKNFVARRGPTWAITNQFSSHASITSLSKAASNEGLLLQDAGTLTDHPFAGAPAAPAGGEADAAGQPKRLYVIRSMTTSFVDLDGNGGFTEGTEKRDRYNVAAAIEGVATTGADGAEVPGFRAMVFADVDLFVDRPTQQGGQLYLETWGGPMPADAIKWIGGEEIFTGQIESENDKDLNQSEKQDTRWFLLMIVGAPALVLVAGLIGTRRRRRADKPRAAKEQSR